MTKSPALAPTESPLAILLGTTHTFHYRARPTDSVGAVSDNDEWTTKPNVLRSGRMVELCESPCMAALQTAMSEGECSLGVLQEFRWLHSAPLPITDAAGNPVALTIAATCTSVIGRRTMWEVSAHSTNAELGRGSMEFVVTNQDRYQNRHGLTPVRPV
jgi:predicted thioesterase